MDTDQLKERIINGALADVFKRSPAQIIPVPRRVQSAMPNEEVAADLDAGVEDIDAVPVFDIPVDSEPPVKD